MKIYTKTGDGGETSLFGGQRVGKEHARIKAYGTVDELNAFIGLARASSPPREIDDILARVQDELFTLGADLATPVDKEKTRVPRISGADAARLEAAIDDADVQLKPLRAFVLPGGSALSSQLHVARTVCRRAERAVIALKRNEQVSDACVVYLNRLSDLLFILARLANLRAGVEEPEWKPGK